MLIPVALLALAAAASPSTGAEGVARQFFEQVSSGHFAAASAPFTDQMKTGMPPDRLERMWHDIQAKQGVFQKVARVASEPVADGTAELVTCRFASRAATFEVYVDASGHIAGFFLTPAPIIARRFINALAKSNFTGAGADFTETMRAALPPAKLASLWKDILAQSGEFQQIERSSVQPAKDDWAALVTVSFAKASVVLRVVVDGEAKIEGFFRQ
jgi:hypothetical protein